MPKSGKYYVVWKGRRTGVFRTWTDCKNQIEGFENASYKSFGSYTEAKAAFEDRPLLSNPLQGVNIIADSLCVDAACSGNPGVMEYQGVHTATKKQLFHKRFPMGTNNIGEFLGLVHGLSYLKKHQLTQPIYTDSANAIKWIANKKCKTKLERNIQTEELFDYIERAEKWLLTHTYTTKIIKWNTKEWGEIPADFGRKQ